MEHLGLKIKIYDGNWRYLLSRFIIYVRSNRLESTVYNKPSDSQLYLEASSCYKKFSTNGIIKGVALSLRSRILKYNHHNTWLT